MSIKLGDSVQIITKIDEQAVLEFAKCSNDYNPIHFEDIAAQKQGYERKIVHGMLIGSLFSRLIGTELPGDGSIYVSQKLQFCRPIYVGDEVKVLVKVIRIDDSIRYKLRTQCFNSSDKLVVDGEAVVLLKREG